MAILHQNILVNLSESMLLILRQNSIPFFRFRNKVIRRLLPHLYIRNQWQMVDLNLAKSTCQVQDLVVFQSTDSLQRQGRFL